MILPLLYPRDTFIHITNNIDHIGFLFWEPSTWCLPIFVTFSLVIFSMVERITHYVILQSNRGTCASIGMCCPTAAHHLARRNSLIKGQFLVHIRFVLYRVQFFQCQSVCQSIFNLITLILILIIRIEIIILILYIFLGTPRNNISLSIHQQSNYDQIHHHGIHLPGDVINVLYFQHVANNWRSHPLEPAPLHTTFISLRRVPYVRVQCRHMDLVQEGSADQQNWNCEMYEATPITC